MHTKYAFASHACFNIHVRELFSKSFDCMEGAVHVSIACGSGGVKVNAVCSRGKEFLHNPDRVPCKVRGCMFHGVPGFLDLESLHEVSGVFEGSVRSVVQPHVRHCTVKERDDHVLLADFHCLALVCYDRLYRLVAVVNVTEFHCVGAKCPFVHHAPDKTAGRYTNTAVALVTVKP